MITTSKSKPPKIFYGWWVVAACGGIMLYTSGIIHFGFTAVFEPIADEFGWSYTQISLAASLRGLETGLLAPVLGILVDRLGPRKIIMTGSLFTGFGMVLLSRINSLGMFYVAFFIIAIGIGTSGHTVMMPAAAYWFRRRISLAMGIIASSAALGGLLIPLITIAVDRFGWRDAMMVMGLSTMVISIPLSLVVRHKPEQYGYLPDGEKNLITGSNEPVTLPPPEIPPLPTREILKNRTFWHISIALALQSVVNGAILTHVMPYLSSVGVSRSTSSLVASALPLMSIAGRLGYGWLGDRFDKRRVAASAFALSAVGIIFFNYVNVNAMWLVVPFLVLYCLGWGGNVTMRPALLREYFGREKFGTIHGFTIGMMHLGNIIGAPFAGWVFDTWHSYQGAWIPLAIVTAIGGFIVAATPDSGVQPQEGFRPAGTGQPG
ncbi:MAG: MFS transporter [Dehalococcoidia bacterium]|nr:MFS transporter [Dehalococcoidia bacterium]